MVTWNSHDIGIIILFGVCADHAHFILINSWSGQIYKYFLTENLGKVIKVLKKPFL